MDSMEPIELSERPTHLVCLKRLPGDALIVSISKDYFIESIQKNNHNICTDIIDHPSDSCLKMLQYVQRYGKSLQKFQTGLKGEMTLLELSAFVGALTHETRDDEGVEFGAKGLNDAEDY